jgi:hypothetical protein
VVAKIDNPTSWVQNTVHVPSTGDYTLHIFYAAGFGQATHALSINAAAPVTVTYPDRGWENWTEVAVNVRLNAGANTIRLTRQSRWAELDHLEVA